MANIIIGDRTNPQCPLCMEMYSYVMYGGMKVYMCERCRTFIREDDRFLNDLLDSNFEDECPLCGTMLRYFRKDNGYYRLQCPRCLFKEEMGVLDEG